MNDALKFNAIASLEIVFSTPIFGIFLSTIAY